MDEISRYLSLRWISDVYPILHKHPHLTLDLSSRGDRGGPVFLGFDRILFRFEYDPYHGILL